MDSLITITMPMTALITWLLAMACLGVAHADPGLVYLPVDQIVPRWTASVAPVGPGNGAFLSPDGAMVVVLSNDASVQAFAIESGAELWTVPAPSATATSTSGIFFSDDSASYSYLCFSYVDSETTHVLRFVLAFVKYWNCYTHTGSGISLW
jgi:hypothetical protein